MRKPFSFAQWKSGLAAGVPIMIGYLPVAVAFGILSKTSGITFGESFSFSAIVFAGASQFIALNLLTMGAGIGEIVLTTLIVNLRHFLMSASLGAKMGRIPHAVKPLLAFGVTDESFSVASFREGELTPEFLLGTELISYAAWVAGTVAGFLLGEILPPTLADSMGIGLYAMFAALLIPQAKKSSRILVMALAAGAVNALLGVLGFLSQSWNLLLSIAAVSLAGMLLTEDEAAQTVQEEEEQAHA